MVGGVLVKANSRFELKYRISLKEYYQLKYAILPYMKQDKYTKAGKNNKYLVRSLYFDTNNFKAYREKHNGDYGRIKFRIRTYTDKPNSKTRFSVELKTR